MPSKPADASTASLEPVCQFLRQVKLSELCDERSVVVLHEYMSCTGALKALSRARILSAPVLSGFEGQGDGTVAVHDHGDGDTLGFVDIRDILLHLLAVVGDVSALVAAPMLRRMELLEGAGSKFSDMRLADVAYGGDGNFLHSGKSRVSVWEVVYSTLLHPERPSRESGRTSAVHHRIALFNSQYQIVQMVSQSDVMRHLHRNKARLSGCLGTRLMDVPGLCSSTVVTMHADKSALEALAVMKQHDISGIAIVDDGGAFLGNFSMSELRSIRVEHLGALALPVAEFLAVTRGTDGSAGGASGNLDEVQNPKILDFLQQPRGKAMRRGALSSEAPAYLPESATFEEMLDLVVSQSAHRAYLVDEESKPVAVATLTDLLYAMAGERATGRPLGDT